MNGQRSELLLGWMFFSLFVLLPSVQCQKKDPPPKVTGSYLAYGEIAETLQDTSGILPQIAFEESYNAETNNAAFSIVSMGMNVTFVEDFNTQQAFRYADNNECTKLNVTEWLNTDAPPSLLHYESTNGTVRFSLKQLFSLDDRYLVEYGMPDTLRGIPARKWMYEITGLEAEGKLRLIVYAYWSAGTWDTAAKTKEVPLGYIVSKITYGVGTVAKVHEQYINVFGFLPNRYNHRAFEPLQWVYCEGRAESLKFPNLNGFQAVSLHSEFILPDYTEIKYLDNWFDPVNKLLRSDYERIKEEDPMREMNERRYQSEITIGQMGVVFRLTYFKGRGGCEVFPVPEYEFDIQNLFNVKLEKWSLGKMFGLNDTKYVYAGKTMKRNIPCHVYQGIRKDWPEPSANVTSLWEWCFNVNMTGNDNVAFRDGEFGLINAQVRILESNMPGFEKGYRIIHHFYHVNYNRDPQLMDATHFEISRCFKETQKRALQFASTFAIDDDNLYLVENATSDTGFLQKWKAAIYQHTTLPPYSLRISQVQTVVLDKKLFVKFLILDVHDALKNGTKQISGRGAEEKLRQSIDKGAVSISHSLRGDSKPDTFEVQKESLRSQLNQTFEPHTLPPPPSPPTTTTSKLITLRTIRPRTAGTRPDDEDTAETDDGVTLSTATEGPNTPGPSNLPKTYRYEGHQGGAVAGVSIAMLLVGISLGSFGTFYKYNGLPSCCKINA